MISILTADYFCDPLYEVSPYPAFALNNSTKETQVHSQPVSSFLSTQNANINCYRRILPQGCLKPYHIEVFFYDFVTSF